MRNSIIRMVGSLVTLIGILLIIAATQPEISNGVISFASGAVTVQGLLMVGGYYDKEVR